MPLFPLLIFPIIAALMITRRHRPRPQHLRGTRSYREAVPAPWNRPDEHFDEPTTQRTAIATTTITAADHHHTDHHDDEGRSFLAEAGSRGSFAVRHAGLLG